MKKLSVILILILIGIITQAQPKTKTKDKIFATYDSVEIYNGVKGKKPFKKKLTTKFEFDSIGFVMEAKDTRILAFFSPNSNLDDEDYRFFNDTGYSLKDTNLNQTGAIYQEDIYKLQVAMYFIGKNVKLLKRDKTYVLFFSPKIKKK